METLLSVQDLHTSFFTPVGEVRAVGGVSFELCRGEVLGIVGRGSAAADEGVEGGPIELAQLLKRPACAHRAVRARRQQNRRHARRLSNANGRNIRFDVLHGVINCQASRN